MDANTIFQNVVWRDDKLSLKVGGFDTRVMSAGALANGDASDGGAFPRKNRYGFAEGGGPCKEHANSSHVR